MAIKTLDTTAQDPVGAINEVLAFNSENSFSFSGFGTVAMTANSARRQIITGDRINCYLRLPAGNTVTGSYVIVNASTEFVGIAKSDGTGMRRLPPGCSMTCVSTDNATPGAWLCELGLMPVHKGVSVTDDILGLDPTKGPLGFAVTNTGAGAVSASSSSANPLRYGRLVSSTGTTDTGASTIQTAYIYSALGAIHCATMIRVPTLPTATEDFHTDTGFFNVFTNAAITNGAWIRVPDSSKTVFQTATARSGGAVEITDTTFTVVANTYYKLTTEISSAGTRLDHWIDGTHIGSYSGVNVPSPAARFACANRIVKSAGTTARTVDVDYMTVTLAQDRE